MWIYKELCLRNGILTKYRIMRKVEDSQIFVTSKCAFSNFSAYWRDKDTRKITLTECTSSNHVFQMSWQFFVIQIYLKFNSFLRCSLYLQESFENELEIAETEIYQSVDVSPSVSRLSCTSTVYVKWIPNSYSNCFFRSCFVVAS